MASMVSREIWYCDFQSSIRRAVAAASACMCRLNSISYSSNSVYRHRAMTVERARRTYPRGTPKLASRFDAMSNPTY